MMHDVGARGRASQSLLILDNTVVYDYNTSSGHPVRDALLAEFVLIHFP
jgi:hypothetical protein